MDLYIEPIGMDGKWLGCIQPMCSAPGHSWQGPFFFQKSAPFQRKCLFGCFYAKTSISIIKRPFCHISLFCSHYQIQKHSNTQNGIIWISRCHCSEKHLAAHTVAHNSGFPESHPYPTLMNMPIRLYRLFLFVSS